MQCCEQSCFIALHMFLMHFTAKFPHVAPNSEAKNVRALENPVKCEWSPNFTDTETRALSPKACCVVFKTNRAQGFLLQADGVATEAPVFPGQLHRSRIFSVIMKRDRENNFPYSEPHSPCSPTKHTGHSDMGQKSLPRMHLFMVSTQVTSPSKTLPETQVSERRNEKTFHGPRQILLHTGYFLEKQSQFALTSCCFPQTKPYGTGL